MRAPALLLTLTLTTTAAAQGLPTSSAPRRGKRVDLRQQVARYRALLDDPRRFRRDNAQQLLSEVYQVLYGLDPARLDLTRLDRDAARIVDDLMGIILALDERLSFFHWEVRGLDPGLIDAKRRILRAVRHLQEVILQRAYERRLLGTSFRLRVRRARSKLPFTKPFRLEAKDIRRLYAGRAPALARDPVRTARRYHWTVAPQYRDRFLRSLPRAFVIMSEGGQNSSAAIARAARVDNQFSHISLAYRSTRSYVVQSKRYPAETLFTVEAHSNSGVVVRPIEKHFDDRNTREVLFVLRDAWRQPALDARAKAFFERALAAETAGKPLAYDFTMGTGRGLRGALAGEKRRKRRGRRTKLRDPQSFYCTSVAKHVFDRAGVTFLTHHSAFKRGSGAQALFASWGIDASQRVPSPGDADVSTTLRRVAEGRDLTRLGEVHRRHAVLTMMFRWMERGYRLESNWLIGTGLKLGQWLDTRFFPDLIPDGLSKEVMTSFILVDKVGNALHAELSRRDAAFRGKTGRHMTPRELHRELERIRVEDLGAWREGPSLAEQAAGSEDLGPLFHQWFRPKE